MKKWIVVSVVAVGLAALPALSPVMAGEAPTNAQLYKMVLELQEKFKKVQAEAARARAKAEAAEAELARTQQELKKARAGVQSNQAQIQKTRKRVDERVTKAAPDAVKVKKRPPGWHVEAELLYLKPHSETLQFATLSEFNMAGTFDEKDVKELELERKAAFRVGAGYRFPCGWDVRASWTRLRSSDSQSIGADALPAAGSTHIFPAPEAGLSTIPIGWYDHARSKARFEYDVVDLTFAHALTRGKRLSTNILLGARYADLELEQKTWYELSFAPGWERYQSRSSRFRGGGLRVGGEAVFDLGWGFNINANIAGSLLYGPLKTRLDAKNSSVRLIPGGDRSKAQKTDNRVIPVLEATVGLGWEYRFTETAGFGVHVGYRFENWFNVDRQFKADDELIIGLNPGNINGIESHDISIDGPYFRIIGFW